MILPYVSLPLHVRPSVIHQPLNLDGGDAAARSMMVGAELLWQYIPSAAAKLKAAAA